MEGSTNKLFSTKKSSTTLNVFLWISWSSEPVAGSGCLTIKAILFFIIQVSGNRLCIISTLIKPWRKWNIEAVNIITKNCWITWLHCFLWIPCSCWRSESSTGTLPLQIVLNIHNIYTERWLQKNGDRQHQFKIILVKIQFLRVLSVNDLKI